MSDDKKGDNRRAALRALRNPYAHHYFFDDDPPEQSPNPVDQVLRASENPYATLHYRDGHPVETNKTSRKSDGAKTLIEKATQAEFRDGCRQIFIKYIPAFEKGRLRKHHLDFINRNIGREPEQRAALLNSLRRYDLTSEGNIRPLFNREEDIFTQEKLLEIEVEALGKGGKK